MPKHTLTIPPSQTALTLDEFLGVAFPRHSIKPLRRLVDEGRVLVNGRPANRADKLAVGDLVELELPEDLPERYEEHALPGPLPLDVIYEDEHLLAIHKPSGLAVGAERDKNATMTLMNALVAWFASGSPFGAERRRPRLVHRLDRGTSGVLLVAAQADTARALSSDFQHGRVSKVYHALVRGRPAAEAGEINQPIGHAARGGLMRVDQAAGKPARTAWRLLEAYRAYSLIEARPFTGRTHQIRVHLAYLGLPLAVDPDYGGGEAILLSEFKRGYKPSRGRPERPLIDRLTLHAAELSLTHPVTAAPLTIRAPYPKDLERAIELLRKWGR